MLCCLEGASDTQVSALCPGRFVFAEVRLSTMVLIRPPGFTAGYNMEPGSEFINVVFYDVREMKAAFLFLPVYVPAGISFFLTQKRDSGGTESSCVINTEGKSEQWAVKSVIRQIVRRVKVVSWRDDVFCFSACLLGRVQFIPRFMYKCQASVTMFFR